MRASPALIVACTLLTACSNRVEKKWASHPAVASQYSATLIEENYNNGETNEYKVRVDAAPSGDDGWFFVSDLATALFITPRPVLQWSSPNDLLVMVHTAEIEGQTVQHFGRDGRPAGSLTIRYIADQRGP